MLQLLNPIWLSGISGILIPLIIHLWNVKIGKTLKVGSIALMGESSRQNSRSLKLTDLLLLFLRCLMIVMLSVLLAQPVWRSREMKEETKAWVLLEKDNLQETYSKFKSEIDSLLDAGNEFHLLEPGFKKADFTKVLADTANADTSEKLPYWSLVRLMEQEIPKDSKAFVFTGDQLNRFKGNRPASAMISWKTYTPSDSTSRWLEYAYLSSSGNTRAILSESNPRGTLRKVIDIDPGIVNTDIKSAIADGKPQLHLNDQNITADTSILTIAVSAEDFPNDAGYLIAAINAIQKYTARKIKIVKPSSAHDILFWLSSKGLPGATLKNMKPGSTVFQYATGKSVSANTWLELSEGQTSVQTEPIAFHKRINYRDEINASPVWEDGFGKPLLDLIKQNNISLYTFYSHLDPEWADLVWSPDFVKLLLPLVIPDTPSVQQEKFDKRRISAGKLTDESSYETKSVIPAADSANNEALSPPTSDIGLQTSDLQFHFWLLLIAIFLTERWLSFKNNLVI